MTYSRLELVKITCDECSEEETLEINSDYEVPEEVEEDWFNKLKKDGWIYNKEDDTHMCPDCVEELKDEEE